MSLEGFQFLRRASDGDSFGPLAVQVFLNRTADTASGSECGDDFILKHGVFVGQERSRCQREATRLPSFRL